MAECKPEKPKPNFEIGEENGEVAAMDFGEEEDAEPEETIIVPQTDRSCVRDLWPFAYGKEYYKNLFAGLLGSEAIAHFTYIAATAHPAALLAGHELGMAVHIVLTKVGQHSISHGKLAAQRHLRRSLETVFERPGP